MIEKSCTCEGIKSKSISWQLIEVLKREKSFCCIKLQFSGTKHLQYHGVYFLKHYPQGHCHHSKYSKTYCLCMSWQHFITRFLFLFFLQRREKKAFRHSRFYFVKHSQGFIFLSKSVSVQSNDSDVTVTTKSRHELALCCMIHPRCKYIRESSILPSAMG